MKFDPKKLYGLDGLDLARLWKLTERLNDGMKLTPDERRDLAQEMQARLSHAHELT